MNSPTPATRGPGPPVAAGSTGRTFLGRRSGPRVQRGAGAWGAMLHRGRRGTGRDVTPRPGSPPRRARPNFRARRRLRASSGSFLYPGGRQPTWRTWGPQGPPLNKHAGKTLRCDPACPRPPSSHPLFRERSAGPSSARDRTHAQDLSPLQVGLQVNTAAPAWRSATGGPQLADVAVDDISHFVRSMYNNRQTNPHAAEFQMHHGRHKPRRSGQPVIGSWIPLRPGATLKRGTCRSSSSSGQYKDPPAVREDFSRRLPRPAVLPGSNSSLDHPGLNPLPFGRAGRGGFLSPRSRANTFAFHSRELNGLAGGRVSRGRCAFRARVRGPTSWPSGCRRLGPPRPSTWSGRTARGRRRSLRGSTGNATAVLRPAACLAARPAWWSVGVRFHAGLPERLRRVGLARQAQGSGTARFLAHGSNGPDRGALEGPEAPRADRRSHGSVLCCTEFGRDPGASRSAPATPPAATGPRPTTPTPFTVWFAGGGGSGEVPSIGATDDELGFHARGRTPITSTDVLRPRRCTCSGLDPPPARRPPGRKSGLENRLTGRPIHQIPVLTTRRPAATSGSERGNRRMPSNRRTHPPHRPCERGSPDGTLLEAAGGRHARPEPARECSAPRPRGGPSGPPFAGRRSVSPSSILFWRPEPTGDPLTSKPGGPPSGFAAPSGRSRRGTPGLLIGEHLPRLARRLRQNSRVRPEHDPPPTTTTAGRPTTCRPGRMWAGSRSAAASNPPPAQDWPAMGSVVEYLAQQVARGGRTGPLPQLRPVLAQLASGGSQEAGQ